MQFDWKSERNALEVNGKGKGRILNKGNVAEGKANMREWIQKFVCKFHKWNRFTG